MNYHKLGMEARVTVDVHNLSTALRLSRITSVTYEFDKGTRGLGQVDLPTEPLLRMGYQITVREINCGEGVVLDATFPRTLELLCHAVGDDGFDNPNNVAKLDLLFRKAVISRPRCSGLNLREASLQGQNTRVILS
jgi:hypothetical protein